MKVLQANKFYYPRGGAERYFLDLLDLLPEHGHEAFPFSMAHPRNPASPFAPHFVSHVDYAAEAGPIGALAMAARTVYNRETRKRARAMARELRPDVAHLHNIHHQLSGSLLEALRAEGVPVVQTLHDYQWVCPVYTFLSHGRICEACRGGRFHRAVTRRCLGGSLARSAVAALELTVGRWRRWADHVRLFLAPSRFLADKVVEHGLPADRVRQQDYALRLERYVPAGSRGNHALYAGRLSHEKGVLTLLEALTRVRNLDLHVAGTGPLEPEVRQEAERRLPGRVRFLGHLEPEALHRAVAEAAFVVVPSEWYENQPFAVLEAFALATPVLGASIGGIPELVIPEETGMLFSSGSAASLAEGLARMSERGDLGALGRGARAYVERRFDARDHVHALLAVYREVAA